MTVIAACHFIVRNPSLYSSEFCFEFGEDDTQFGKLFVKVTPLPQFQKPQLEAFTADFQFIPFSGNYQPTFLSYGTFIDDEKAIFREMIVFFLPNGRLSQQGDADESVGLYADPGRDSNTAVRITIAGDKDSFTVFFDTEQKESRQNEWKSVPMGGSWVLGQQQDEFEGGFDVEDRVKGKICNFQMWDFKLSKEQLGLLFASDISVQGNLFNSPPTYQYSYENKDTLSIG